MGDPKPRAHKWERGIIKSGTAMYSDFREREALGLTDLVGPLQQRVYAAARGESANGFINRAIDSQMERDASSGPTEAPAALSGVGAVGPCPLALSKPPERPRRRRERLCRYSLVER